MDAETPRVMKEALARMGTWTERDGAELEASVKLAAQFLAQPDVALAAVRDCASGP